MAKKGTVKQLSVAHEDHIARLFDGRRSPSSGAAFTDLGDVKTDTLLIECKMTMQAKPKYVTQFEKIAEEAWQGGKDPVLALRFYDPQSPLAGSDGYIDLTMMLATDHQVRDEAYNAGI